MLDARKSQVSQQLALSLDGRGRCHSALQLSSRRRSCSICQIGHNRGNRAAMFLCEESFNRLLNRTDGIGMDLRNKPFNESPEFREFQ